MKKGIFITGTDTGVGKTYVAAGIAKEFRSRGIDVGVMKPAETGCRMRGGKLVPPDSLGLMRAANVRDRLDVVNPFRFRTPLAPMVAASFARKSIDIGRIMKAYRTLGRRHDFMIVEGAGGIMVPLKEHMLFLDLAVRMKLPALIVARPGLGTINHTLLTVEALRKKKVPIEGIVISYGTDERTGLAERTSPEVIERMSGTRIMGIVRYGSCDFSGIVDQLFRSQKKTPVSRRK